jgi:hypothetical protein
MWRFNRPFDAFGAGSRYPGQEPLGSYPIHIIVNGGHIILEGVVDNQADKNLAGMRARGISGAFSVENELQVNGTTLARRNHGKDPFLPLVADDAQVDAHLYWHKTSSVPQSLDRFRFRSVLMSSRRQADDVSAATEAENIAHDPFKSPPEGAPCLHELRDLFTPE